MRRDRAGRHERGHRHHAQDRRHGGRRDHRKDDRRGRSRRQPGTWASSPGSGGACPDDRAHHRRGSPADAADAGRNHRRPEPRADAHCPGRAPDGDPCPGWARTGCCRDAESPDVPRDVGREPSSWSRQQGLRGSRTQATRGPMGSPGCRHSAHAGVRGAARRPWPQGPRQRARRQVPRRRVPPQRVPPQRPRAVPSPRSAARRASQQPAGPASRPVRPPSSCRGPWARAPWAAPRGQPGLPPSDRRRTPCGNASRQAARRSSSPT